MLPRPDITAAIAAAARTIDVRYTLEDTLAAIAQTAQMAIPGIDHVGISTIERGGLVRTRAATDDVVRQLDDLQYHLDEGPCVDALRLADVVAVPDIRHDDRWPRYVARAVPDTGLESQLAVRLFLDGEGTLGSLNLYSTSQPTIDPDAESVADLFAAHAAIALGHSRRVSTLSEALTSRGNIGKAIGILMERHQIDEDHAFAFLRRASSHGNLKLREVAAEILSVGNTRIAPEAALVAQATGILWQRQDMTLEDAMTYLLRVSDETGVECADLARLVVRAGVRRASP
jgi:GAF domain-containing protein